MLGSSSWAIRFGSNALDNELTDRSNRVTVRVVIDDVEDRAVGIERKLPVPRVLPYHSFEAATTVMDTIAAHSACIRYTNGLVAELGGPAATDPPACMVVVVADLEPYSSLEV